MFAKACEKALSYTHPVVVSTKTVDGTLASNVGTYFFISRDGWAISAAHVFMSFMKYQYDQNHIKEINEIQERDRKEGKTSQAFLDPKWLTNHSAWFGADQIRLSQLHIFGAQDIAAFKLENVPAEFTKEIAVFGNAESLRPGTSLCKLGYPFISLKPEFENNNFRLPPSTNNLPTFPLDGIFTRYILENHGNGQPVQKYLETTSAGLKGQSGGPVFDVNGVVYGVQVKTAHLPLGFSPTVTEGDKTTTEHQFLNTGLAVPVDVIEKLLLDKKVPFETVNKGSDGSCYIIR